MDRLVRYRVRIDITEAFGVQWENDNGRRMVDFYIETGLCIGITYFNVKTELE